MAQRIDLAERLHRAQESARRSHHLHCNPALARLVETLGFDQTYVRGEGQYLWDQHGRKILDCLAGYGAVALGRNHPVVRDALEQCLKLAPPTWVRFELNPLAGEAARVLKAPCGPGLDHVFFTNSGTEGVEAAIKLARQHTQRAGIAAWGDSFHGLSCGALSINGSAELQRGFGPLLPDAVLVPFGDLNALDRALRPQTTAALFVEPVQGKTVRALAPGQLQDVQRMCRRHGTLLVADEVQTGIGRTGKFLASHHDGVQADMVVLSKALSGGFMPVGAVLVRGDIWTSTFSSMDRAIVHSSTLHESALAMTALIATVEIVVQDGLAMRAQQLGALLSQRLQAECAGCPCVREVRGQGLMVGIDLDAEKVPHLAGVPVLGQMTEPLVGQSATMSLLADHALLAQTTGARRPLLKFVPPLVIDETDVEWIATAAGVVCKKLASGGFYGALGRVATNAVRGALGVR